MASYYCQPNLYTYSATPGAGVAQEGDGTGTGTATAASLSIDLTSATADAGDTFTVAGAVLTCVASGAGNNQFNAGSGSTLASNLATAINRTTNTVTVNAAATNWDTPPIQNAVYAYTSSATLYIQTRAGSATYNSNSNFQVAQSGITGLTGPWQFADGVSGSWGWLFNDNVTGALWPTAEATYTYGILFSATKKRPLAGLLPTASDIVNIRANNVELKSKGYVNATVDVAVNNVSNWVVDDGTIWSGDTGVLTLRHTPGLSYNFSLTFPQGGPTVFRARTLGRINFLNDGNGGGVIVLTTVANPSLGTTYHFENLLFTTSNGGPCRIYTANSGGILTIRKCKWNVTSNNYYQIVFPPNGGYNKLKYVYDSCIFDFSAYTGVPNGLVTSGNTGGLMLLIKDCTQISPNPGPIFTNFGGANHQFLAVNCTGFSQYSSFAGVTGLDASAAGSNDRGYALMQNIGGDRDFRLEHPNFYLDWFASQGYPVSDSYLPSGTTWSYRLYWSGSSGTARHCEPVEILALTKTNILSDGTRTIAMELLVDDAYDHLITDAHFELVLTYKKAADGSMVTERTLADLTKLTTGTGSALPSSSKSWTLNSYTGHVARKLAITTAQSVKANTEVEARLIMWTYAPTTYTYVFINPELTIT